MTKPGITLLDLQTHTKATYASLWRTTLEEGNCDRVLRKLSCDIARSSVAASTEDAHLDGPS